MSKTPRTDEAIIGDGFPAPMVSADFARQLETELAAKTAELWELKKKLEEVQSNCVTLNVRCQMWYQDFKKLKQVAVEASANAFEEAAGIAAANGAVETHRDLKRKAAAIRKGEEK